MSQEIIKNPGSFNNYRESVKDLEYSERELIQTYSTHLGEYYRKVNDSQKEVGEIAVKELITNKNGGYIVE